MRSEIIKSLQVALKELLGEANVIPTICLKEPPKRELGHYATAIALELAKLLKKKPLEIANSLRIYLLQNDLIESVSIERPGFLNIYLNSKALFENILKKSIQDRISFWVTPPSGKILIEFVSANPTGPLNIVSARAASVGDSIVRVVRATGGEINSEYYVNDYGNQVRLLGISFATRYLQTQGYSIDFPEDGYQGEYVFEVLNSIIKLNSTKFPSLPLNGNEASWIQVSAPLFEQLAIEALLKKHQDDLNNFRVKFDNFFSETSLHKKGKVDQAQEKLEKLNFTYKKQEAVYFCATKFGDEKDRVIRRSDGRATYLLADIAYHLDKIDRGYQKIFNLWGPDHHGYINRLTGALKANGFPSKKIQEFAVFIVQQVNMMEAGKVVVMSKRLGKFQTMQDLLNSIPVDVARYFFLMRSQSTHLDFDLELAMSQSFQNPVYYIQYAHARIYSIFRETDHLFESQNWEKIYPTESRINLAVSLLYFYEELEYCANHFEVHKLANYLYKLAKQFTAFYHHPENRIIVLLKRNRDEGKFVLDLCRITAEYIKFGLDLLGISSPKEM